MNAARGRIAGWLAWLLPLGVYVASLSGAPAYWDTGEAQTVPWIFGIMHPTGFPAFTILAGIFAHLVAIGTVAWRISLFSALAMSGGAWFVSRVVTALEGDPWLGAIAAWLFAFGEVAWTRGTRAEVHALALFFAMAALYGAVRWRRFAEPRALIFGSLAWGLGIATHPIVALLLPALLVFLLARARSLTRGLLAAGAAAALFGLAWYAYLPARSAAVTAAHLDPTRALGFAAGGAFWDTNHPASWSGFVQEISGDQFKAGGAVARILMPATYASALPQFFESLAQECTPLALVFGLGGWYALLRRDRWSAAAFALAFAVPAAFGLTYTIEADPLRYYLTAYGIAAVLAAYGASEAARELPPLRRTVTLLLAAMAALLLVLNRGTLAQRDSQGARAVIQTVLKKTPANAVLITSWTNATPLAYAAYVEHRLGKRTLETAWLADVAKSVPVWTRTRPVYVVGMLWGHVPGYSAIRLHRSPDLYRVVRSRVLRPSSPR